MRPSADLKLIVIQSESMFLATFRGDQKRLARSILDVKSEGNRLVWSVGGSEQGCRRCAMICCHKLEIKQCEHKRKGSPGDVWGWSGRADKIDSRRKK